MTPEELEQQKSERIGNGIGDNNGLSWTCGYCNIVGRQDVSVSERDRGILRDLAKRVLEIASWPEQKKKKTLWIDHHALKETRPLIFCDPENAWYEIIPHDQLQCQGNLARIWEFKLLKEIYWAEKIKDDRVIEPAFKVHYIYSETSRGLDSNRIGGEKDGAYTWDAPLVHYEDIDKLRPKKVVVDFAKTKEVFELASEVLGDILEVRLEGVWWWSLGLTSDLIMLRGFENVLFDFYDNPDELHNVMAFLRDEALGKLDFLESNGLLTLNNAGDYTGTGAFGWSKELPSPGFNGRNVRTMDMWGYCESQETVSVSPDLFEEFVFRYQLPIMERFGLNIYGCCEPLDQRMDIIKRIPRLRKITVSPWSDVSAMAEMIGKDYVYCRKVTPADIAVPVIDEEYIRQGLRNTYREIKRCGCRAEFLMRDIQTLAWKPENAIRWTRIAREELDG